MKLGSLFAAALAVGGETYYLGKGFIWNAYIGMTFRLIFRSLALLLIAGALVFAPMPGHQGHGVMAHVSVEEAAHGHAHGDDLEHSHPHLPGHDAADHSHQFLFMADSVTQSAYAAQSQWQFPANLMPDPGFASGLERPPKRA